MPDDVKELVMTASDRSGILYAIHNDGRLLFFRDLLRDGTNAANGSVGWDPKSGSQIGQHFEGIRQLVGGGDGILYAIHDDGRLLFFRDLLRDGTNAADGSVGWDSKSGSQIGQHFEGIRQLVDGGDGILYAIHNDGRLLFFRDLLRDGSNAADGSVGWDSNSGNQVGQHFEGIRQLVGGGDGILYAIHNDGRLLFFRDLLRDGSNAADGSVGWDSNSGNQVGQHFEGIRQLIGGGDGILYAIHNDGRLLFFRDLLRDGSNAADGSVGWDSNSGNQVGQHFEGIRQLA